MHFETTLNVVWLGLGFLALANTIRMALDKRHAPRRGRAWLHIVGVALIVAALFPYISATDDILRVEQLNSHEHAQHHGKQNGSDNLIRLYETMDTPLVGHVSEVEVTFSFVSLVPAPVPNAIDRVAPFEAGRSPPSLFARVS